MGLDMYLSASKYVSCWDHKPEADKKKFNDVLKAVGFQPDDVANDSPSMTIDLTVGYWRKANQIHKWFVDNTQGGVDECQRTFVTRGQLKELLTLCYEAERNHDPKLLPPQEGFFFGSTDADEWYWHQIAQTINILTHALHSKTLEDCSFEYHSSW